MLFHSSSKGTGAKNQDRCGNQSKRKQDSLQKSKKVFFVGMLLLGFPDSKNENKNELQKDDLKEIGIICYKLEPSLLFSKVIDR